MAPRRNVMQLTARVFDVAETKRKLAAILSADVAGYSRLMGADEEATIAALDARRARLLPLPLVGKAIAYAPSGRFRRSPRDGHN